MAAVIATELLAACQRARHEERSPLLALAGGNTPLPAYRALAANLGDMALTVIPSDERCVPHDDPACNFDALRRVFADARGVRCLPLTTADGIAPDSLNLARDTLATLPMFDATVLGMGTDGHFASLFPGSAGLVGGLDPRTDDDAIALMPAHLPAEAPYERITLTLPRLLRSRHVMLVISGEAKRDVLESAMTREADPIRCPVAALLRAAPALSVHWSP